MHTPYRVVFDTQPVTSSYGSLGPSGVQLILCIHVCSNGHTESHSPGAAGEQLVLAWGQWYTARGAPEVPYHSTTAKAALHHQYFTAYPSPLNGSVKLLALDMEAMLILAEAIGCAEASTLHASLTSRAAMPAGDSAPSSSLVARAAGQHSSTVQPGPAARSSTSASGPHNSSDMPASILQTCRRGVQMVWPGSDDHSVMCRVAAAALLSAPDHTISKSALGNVFTASHDLDWNAYKGGKLRIEAVLSADPCFICQPAPHCDILFTLSLEQLAARMEQQVATAGSSTSGRCAAAPAGPRLQIPGIPAVAKPAATAPAAAGASRDVHSPATLQQLQQALHLLWPDSLSNEQRLLRLAAAALLQAPGRTLTTTQLGKLFNQQASDIWQPQRSTTAPAAAGSWRRPKIPALLTVPDKHKVFHLALICDGESSVTLEMGKALRAVEAAVARVPGRAAQPAVLALLRLLRPASGASTAATSASISASGTSTSAHASTSTTSWAAAVASSSVPRSGTTLRVLSTPPPPPPRQAPAAPAAELHYAGPSPTGQMTAEMELALLLASAEEQQPQQHAAGQPQQQAAAQQALQQAQQPTDDTAAADMPVPGLLDTSGDASCAIRGPALTAAQLQQAEQEAAAAAVHVITSATGPEATSMLQHLAACKALGVALKAGTQGKACLLQVSCSATRHHGKRGRTVWHFMHGPDS